MPKSKYLDIYTILKQRISNGEYIFQQLLPSENDFVKEFDCSRNTIRRALQMLTTEGYVQTIHGKGVRVIFEPMGKKQFLLGNVETLAETAERINATWKTKVLYFAEVLVDKKLHKLTGFALDKELYIVQRIRYFNDRPLIIDHNFFLKDIVTKLTKDIAEDSIYHYLENDLKINIVTTKRVFTVQKATTLDKQYLDLDDCNCVAVLNNTTFNDDGIMFEFTQSRHSPMHFEFYDVATRTKPIKA